MHAEARDVITSGLLARAFPGAVVEVGGAAGPIWCEAFGHLSYAEHAPACRTDTIFDLASLTKVIATTSLVMTHVGAGRLTLDTPIAAWVPQWRGADRSSVTVRQLLDHSSGLPAHARLWEETQGRAAIEHAICTLRLIAAPGEAALYSDPGFMLLGFLLERVASRTLDDQFSALPIASADALMFRPAAELRDRIAPTEDDPWRGRVLQGEVHDENAAALDGVAGHAGLFGTAPAVGAFARVVLQTFRETTWLGTPQEIARFAARTGVRGSSRALGWDTMQPTSSCGTRMSPTAIGHTGFTGTSLWIDHERDLYVVLLANRVHPTRADNAMIALRPRLHDAILAERLR